MREQKTFGILLWVGAALMLFGQLIHPTGEGQELDKLTMAGLIANDWVGLWSHIAFLIAFPLIFIGLIGLLQPVMQRMASITALMLWGLGSMAAALSVTFAIFVTRALAVDYLGASVEMRPSIEAQLNFSGTISGLFALAMFAMLPATFLFIGMALLQWHPTTTQRFTNLLGSSSIAIGGLGIITAFGMATAQPWFMMVEMGLVLLMVVWLVAAGFWLCREPRQFVSGPSQSVVAATT